MVTPSSILFERGRRLEREEMLVFKEANLRGYSVRYVCIKHLLRKRPDAIPKEGELPVGTIQFIHAACKSIGREIAPADYYPACLTPWLFRKVWKSTYKDVYRYLENGGTPIFIKSVKLKKLSGKVVTFETDLQALQCSKNLELWCSEVVEWRAEFRVYVVNRKIVHVGWYENKDNLCLNMNAVESALQAMWDANYPISNFCIDFGVLDNGETALIEMGDGYSMGAYDIPAADYLTLLQNWWLSV